jgi:hypothetical protein
MTVRKETNHEKFARVFAHYRGTNAEFSSSQIGQMLKGVVAPGSQLPNDHADGNKGSCKCVGTPRQIFDRTPNGYRVRDFAEYPRPASVPTLATADLSPLAEPPGYPSVGALDEIVGRLIAQTPMAFTLSNEKNVPTLHGIYAIYTKSRACLHAGRTRTTSLRNRLFAQHFRGGGKGAGSDLVQKIQSRGYANDKLNAQAWIEQNCLVRFIVVADPLARHWAELRLLSHLRPLWCVPSSDMVG